MQVVIASMRQLVRLKEGQTAKVKDIPGFLTQCIASKVSIGTQQSLYCIDLRELHTYMKLFSLSSKYLPKILIKKKCFE